MTTKIALDTNIWIYLTKDMLQELRTEFKRAKDSGEIEIIVNDINIIEWDRNKEKTIGGLAESIKSEYRAALKLANYLSEEARSEHVRILSEYEDEAARITKAEQRVNEIGEFMKTCTVIEVTDEQKLFVANLNIQKVPPFQSTKSNFNDALMVRSFCEHVNSNLPMKHDLIYVSNNPKDFTDNKTGQVYECLLEGLEPIRLANVTELNHALHLAPELIDDFEEWLDSQLDDEAMRQLEIMRGK